jgi:quercetin dioxygenase-like cupin family protein
MGVQRAIELVPPVAGSELALVQVVLRAGASHGLGGPEHDTLLYVTEGSGALGLAGEQLEVEAGSAALVLAGEQATIAAATGLAVLAITIGPGADLHAPLGRREAVTRLEAARSEAATGARSFQILFGPHNGSTRATLFAGYIPPGKAPCHYHLYDEIVYVPDGPGRLHLEGDERELGPGAAFRLRPRQVHIVENAGGDEMTILGVFTPAGSPSAAYLTPEVAAEYRFAGS